MPSILVTLFCADRLTDLCTSTVSPTTRTPPRLNGNALDMKFFTLLSAVGLLWLSGCASTGGALSSAPSVSSDAAPQTQNVTQAPAPVARASQSANNTSVSTTDALTPIQTNDARSQTVAPLAAPADLWERIRRGFAMPDLESDLVRDREQWYVTRPDYIFRMTERSRKYLFHIVEELERRNMPTELALLPFIESAFNPQALSSAKASGIWQFMPKTGKQYDLKQNAFRDDRRDVLASTRAALDYLQRLHGMFGDWQLALAAYNWGEGSVGRAIAKNQRAGLGVRYTDLNMPMETRFYVPKLQAVKNIVAQPDSFKSKLPLIGNHPYFDSVVITRDIDVALAAKLAEVPLDDFKALNPSLSRPVILAAGTPQILLPWDNATLFQRNLDTFTGTRLASWMVWVAPMTLKPAEAAKRAGMGETEFRTVNNIPPRMTIRAGSSLLVPRPAHIEKDVTEHVADNGQMSLAPDVVPKRGGKKGGKTATVVAGKGKGSVRHTAKQAKHSPAKTGKSKPVQLAKK